MTMGDDEECKFLLYPVLPVVCVCHVQAAAWFIDQENRSYCLPSVHTPDTLEDRGRLRTPHRLIR